jgi:hypothetical protein
MKTVDAALLFAKFCLSLQSMEAVMAHLTIRLGAPLIIPFRIPRVGRFRGRGKARIASLRWQALCEARVVTRERAETGRRVAFLNVNPTGKSRRQSALGSGRDIWS